MQCEVTIGLWVGAGERALGGAREITVDWVEEEGKGQIRGREKGREENVTIPLMGRGTACVEVPVCLYMLFFCQCFNIHGKSIF